MKNYGIRHEREGRVFDLTIGSEIIAFCYSLLSLSSLTQSAILLRYGVCGSNLRQREKNNQAVTCFCVPKFVDGLHGLFIDRLHGVYPVQHNINRNIGQKSGVAVVCFIETNEFIKNSKYFRLWQFFIRKCNAQTL